jgi:copper(I)-binding protein
VRDLLRAVAGPVICAAVVTGLLAAWAGTGGGGTLTRVRLQVTQAAVPMRAFTPKAADAVRTATTFLTIRNLSGTPDELVAARSPFAHRVLLTQRTGPTGPAADVGALVIPAHGTLTLTPFGDDLILQQPSPYESQATVPLTLTFRHAGTVTVDATVTGPGTP